MAILAHAPEDFRKLRLYQLLRSKSNASDGAAERAEAFIQAATPLVDLIIAGPLREFTLHNRDHCKKILHLAEYIIAPATFESLTVLDCLVMIFAAYLHDMGMALTATERNRIIASAEFYQEARGWPELWAELAAARASLSRADEASMPEIETRVFQLQEGVLAKLLRARHSSEERYRELIGMLKRDTNRSDLFEFRGVSLEEYVIKICASHNQDVAVLAEVAGPYDERFPRELLVGGEHLNMQFCAAVLRLTDILDFDRERTPKVLFESLGLASRSLPGADISLREWQKHLAVHSIEFNKHEIVVVADSKHPVIQHSILKFTADIEREVRDTLAVLKRNPQHILDRYSIELPVRVRPQIRPLGYVYKEMALGLNEGAIMSLLMGDRLYSHPAVAVRELIQNSLDACAVRLQMDGAGFQPRIEVDSFIDESGKRWIRIVDNGIGMDEYVLSEYFLKLGNSYYSSPEFERAFWEVSKGGGFTPISRFGIGIISVFMIGDVLEVRTRAARSPRLDNRQRTVRVEKMGSLAFVTETDSDLVGTTISVRLRPEIQPKYGPFATAVTGYLQEVVLRPRFDVHLKLAHAAKLAAPPPLTVKAASRAALQLIGVEPFAIDLARWSERLTGTVIVAFARAADGRLSHELNGKPIKFIRGSIDPNTLIEGYAGNRLTVNGFRMSIKRISRILGIGSVRIPIAFDVDVAGHADIVYDVARDRIIGRGRFTVAKAFREALQSGLQDLGVLSRLSKDTRHVIDQSFQVFTSQESDREASGIWLGHRVAVLDSALLDATADMLPTGDWPKNIHKLVAERLGVSNNLASRAISTLIDVGRIRRPNQTKPPE